MTEAEARERMMQLQNSIKSFVQSIAAKKFDLELNNVLLAHMNTELAKLKRAWPNLFKVEERIEVA